MLFIIVISTHMLVAAQSNVSACRALCRALCGGRSGSRLNEIFNRPRAPGRAGAARRDASDVPDRLSTPQSQTAPRAGGEPGRRAAAGRV